MKMMASEVSWKKTMTKTRFPLLDLDPRLCRTNFVFAPQPEGLAPEKLKRVGNCRHFIFEHFILPS
jgi:hypothetical protein